MIDAVNVTPSSPGISPRPVVVVVVVVIITRSSSVHATPDVPWFGPVLLRLVQRHERSKERDEDVQNPPKEVREYRRSKRGLDLAVVPEDETYFCSPLFGGGIGAAIVGVVLVAQNKRRVQK